jgi:hypothetical protein
MHGSRHSHRINYHRPGRRTSNDRSVRGLAPVSCASDYDLLSDIRAKVRGLLIKIHWKWIKGHQYDGPFHASLDEWAQANIYMDSMAKAYWNYLNDNGHCPSPV